MARLSGLVEGTAKALRIAPETVALCARYLRESGLIAETGRGLGAAEMGPRDAANLVLALMASDAIKDAPRHVKRAAAASFVGADSNLRSELAQELPPCSFLKDATGAPNTLGAAFAALFDEMLRFGDPMHNDLPIANMWLHVKRPGRYVAFEIDSGSEIHFVRYESLHPKLKGLSGDGLREAAKAVAHEEADAMETRTTVGLSALWAIVKVLKAVPRRKRRGAA